MAFLYVLYHGTRETIGTLETLFYPKNGLKSAKKGNIRLIFEPKFNQKPAKSTKKLCFLLIFHQKNDKNQQK